LIIKSLSDEGFGDYWTTKKRLPTAFQMKVLVITGPVESDHQEPF